jgi:hypothetical protein
MEELRSYRRIGKVTQRDVSKLSGVPVWKLSLAECGQIELSQQERAAVMEALRKNLENLATRAAEVGQELLQHAVAV